MSREKFMKIAWLLVSCIGLPIYIIAAWNNIFHLPEVYRIAYLIPIFFYASILGGFAVAWQTLREDKALQTSTQQQTREIEK